MVRLTCDPRTKAYAKRRRAEGETSREIIRCLKRYIAREVHALLTRPRPIGDIADLRPARLAAGTTLATAAAELNTWHIRLTELERGIRRSTELEDRYRAWLAPQPN